MRISPGPRLVFGILVLLVGIGLMWIGLDGLLGLTTPVECSPPGNPDCLPIPGEDTTYRDVVVLGAALTTTAGYVLGRLRRGRDG